MNLYYFQPGKGIKQLLLSVKHCRPSEHALGKTQCFLQINFKTRSWNQLRQIFKKKRITIFPLLDTVGFINDNQIQPLPISGTSYQYGLPSATSQKRLWRPKHDLI